MTKSLKEKGYQFKTRSDTETILHLYEEYGTDCVHHLQGMFAFAVYEIPQRKLFLARDRLGVKPLYYWFENGNLVFASEIKSILEHDAVPREPYLPAIDSYLTFRYSPGPETMFSGIHKFPAAHWATWDAGKFELKNYWNPKIYNGPYKPDSYYHARFSELFEESVRMRMMSEMPIGAFLSGGVDSTAIVATMAKLTDKPINTFPVGFDWPGDELSAAREVSEKLGCKHHEIICKKEDMSRLPEIIWSLDEPIGDAIVFPMHLLSEFARQQVSVVLSGEGADEILAGYFFHKVLFLAHKYSRWTPKSLLNLVATPLIHFLPHSLLNLAFSYPEGIAKRGKLKLLDYLELLETQDPIQEYHFLISLFDKRDKNDLYTKKMAPFNIETLSSKSRNEIKNDSYLNTILGLQYSHWLPDDILMKLDKMTMANSLEGRVPFLDHKLVEFLFETPPHLKLKGLMDKVILRNHLSKLIPGKFAKRPKKPFYIPIGQFLNEKPLKDYVDSLLSEESVKRRGYFNWEKVRSLRNSIGKEFVYDKQVFALVALELWHRIFIDRESGWIT